MATSSSSSPGPDNNEIDPLVALKRHIAALKEENADLQVRGLPGKKSYVYFLKYWHNKLIKNQKDLVAEFNRRIGLGTDNESDADKMDSDDPEQYCSFKKLMVWCPLARKLLWSSAKHDVLAFAYNMLNEGSDGARGDDSASLKCAVADWLMERTPTPNPTIHRQDKSGRGFYNNVTGGLLCPVDYDWSNLMQTTYKAYVSVQLRFALSSAGSWHIVDDEFNHQEFYDNIVDYLELPPSPEATKDVDDLLLWWNQKVFGRKFVSDYRPQHANKMSVTMTLARRC
ncbi:hypothetical protein BDR06DRAFT_978116 [Suillus hirtellus]|nr:hypothetical protein BDR06DRAFT_978116 [Suillus hirtellus]